MRRLRALTAITGVSLMLGTLGAHAQTVGLATAAIEHHNGVSLHKWRFDRLSVVDDEQWRERCKGVDFHKAECRLLSVDDQPADAVAQENYREKYAQPIEDNLPNLDPRDFVDVTTLALDDAQDDVVRFRFNGAADTPEEYMKEGRLKGTLAVDREDGYIRSLKLSNSEAFKPATGVKIKQLDINVQFVRIEEQVFAERVSMRMQGRAFGLKKLEQDQVVRFENFTPPQ